MTATNPHFPSRWFVLGDRRALGALALPVVFALSAAGTGVGAGVGSVLCPQAWAAPKTAPKPEAAPNEANDPKLRGLRTRLFKAETDVAGLRKQIGRFPIFSLRGKYEAGDEKAISVYGTARDSTGSHPFGVLNEDTFYTVTEPHPEHLRDGFFEGAYVFVGAPRGRNVYARPSMEYYRLVTSYNARVKQKETLEQAVNARLGEIRGVAVGKARARAQAEQERRDAAARVEAAKRAEAEKKRKAEAAAAVTTFLVQQKELEAGAGTDTDLLGKLAQKTLDFKAKMHAGDDSLTLRVYYVFQMSHLAALHAQKGDLAASMEAASKAFWFEATGPGTGSDLARQEFGGIAATIYAQQPQLLGRLVGAWAQALPEYTKKAEYVEALKARKFSEVMLRCMQALPVPEKAQLQAAWQAVSGAQAPTQEEGPETGGASSADLETVFDPTAAEEPANPLEAAGTTPGAPAQAPAPRQKAFNFSFRTLQDGKAHQLTDFVGRQAVVLLFFSFGTEDDAIAPSPVEQLCAIARQYDPKKVVFLLVATGTGRDLTAENFEQRTDPEKNQRVMGPVPLLRSYTGPALFCYDPTPTQRGIRNQLRFFYRSDNKRVAVIDLQGDVAGHMNFESDGELSYKNRLDGLAEQDVYSLDKDALDQLILQALTPAPK